MEIQTLEKLKPAIQWLKNHRGCRWLLRLITWWLKRRKESWRQWRFRAAERYGRFDPYSNGLFPHDDYVVQLNLSCKKCDELSIMIFYFDPDSPTSIGG